MHHKKSGASPQNAVLKVRPGAEWVKLLKVGWFQNVLWYLQVSQNIKQKKSSLLLWYLKSNCFRLYFGRMKTPIRHFEINWPLQKQLHWSNLFDENLCWVDGSTLVTDLVLDWQWVRLAILALLGLQYVKLKMLHIKSNHNSDPNF